MITHPLATISCTAEHELSNYFRIAWVSWAYPHPATANNPDGRPFSQNPEPDERLPSYLRKKFHSSSAKLIDLDQPMALRPLPFKLDQASARRDVLCLLSSASSIVCLFARGSLCSVCPPLPHQISPSIGGSCPVLSKFLTSLPEFPRHPAFSFLTPPA